MTATGTNPHDFYSERIPAQFNRALEQAKHADDEVLAGKLAAVDATLRIIVEADDGGTFHLNVDAGRMSAGESAAHPVLLTLVHDRAAFEALAREAGDSALGFLGGIAGIAGEVRLTSERAAQLARIDGCVRLGLLGEAGFALHAYFGSALPGAEPRCTIEVEAEAWARLRRGELDPQDAFLTQQIRVEGDVAMAMQLALAMVEPD
jgi:hypothetical protein